MGHAKKQESMANTQRKNQSIEVVPEEAQMLDYLTKTLNHPFLNILKELEKIMSKTKGEYENDGSLSKTHQLRNVNY